MGTDGLKIIGMPLANNTNNTVTPMLTLRPQSLDDEFPGIQLKLNKNKNAKKIKKEALKSMYININLKI